MSSPVEPQPPRPGHGFRRRVLTGVSWLMLGRVASIMAMLGIYALLSKGKLLDKAENSAFVLSSFLVPFVAQLVNLGSTDVLLRVIRKSYLEGKPALGRQGVLACVKLFLVSGVVTSVLFVVLCRVIAAYKPSWMVISESVGWVCLWIWLYSCAQIVSEMFRGRDQFWLSSAVFSLSGGWLPNLLTVAALAASPWWTDDLSFRATIAVHVAALAMTIAFGALWSSRMTRQKPVLASSHVSASASKDGIPDTLGVGWMLRESWPVFLSVITLLGIEQLDIFLVSLFTTSADVADYGYAKRCLGLVNFAFVTLAPALSPFVAELYHHGEMRRLERLVRGASTLIGVPCVLLCVVFFVVADPLVVALFGQQHAGAALSLRILLVGQAFLFLAGHANTVLVMSGHQRLLMRSNVAVGLLFALVCPVATYGWGVAGAAVAKSLATAERAASAALIVRRVLGIWTTSSLSPAEITETLRLLLKRAKPRAADPEAAAPSNLE